MYITLRVAWMEEKFFTNWLLALEVGMISRQVPYCFHKLPRVWLMCFVFLTSVAKPTRKVALGIPTERAEEALTQYWLLLHVWISGYISVAYDFYTWYFHTSSVLFLKRLPLLRCLWTFRLSDFFFLFLLNVTAVFFFSVTICFPFVVTFRSYIFITPWLFLRLLGAQTRYCQSIRFTPNIVTAERIFIKFSIGVLYTKL